MTEYAFNVVSEMLHIQPCHHVNQKDPHNWILFPDHQAAKQWLTEQEVKPVLCSVCYRETEWRKIK